MTSHRRMLRRALAIAAAGALVLYAALVIVRVLYPLENAERVLVHASALGLDPALVASLVRAESRFHADAVSSRGAVGLMQLMPDTATWIAQKLGVAAFDLADPETNLWFGTWYLRYLVDRFGRTDLAVAAYNAGPSRMDQWLASGDTVYPETSAFVRRVLRGIPVYHFLLRAPTLVRITPSLPL